MFDVFTNRETYTVVTCCSCGISFGMSEGMYAQRVKDQKAWHCPNGHMQHFTGETEAAKARRERDAAEARAVRLQASLDQQREEAKHLERRRRAAAGAATRIRNRIKHGVCPCCSKRFDDLADHMRDAHPEFRPTDVEPAATANL